MFLCFFFFNDTATTEIYTLSLHDALPILPGDHRLVAPRLSRWRPHHRDRQRVEDTAARRRPSHVGPVAPRPLQRARGGADRKSTRLNSSHANISYAVFCLKKKKKHTSELQ